MDAEEELGSVLDEPLEKTSEQLLKEINDKQKELKDEKVTVPTQPEPPAPVVSPEPAPPALPATPDKPSETGTPSVLPGEEVPVPPPNSDKTGDIEDWMKKKGFKSKEDMAKSLRHLERRLHSETRQNKVTPTVDHPPLPTVLPRQPSVPASPQLEEIAKQYDMDPDDLRRMGPLIADISGNAINQHVGPLMKKIERLQGALGRKDAAEQLESDPTFHDPTVIKEMHEIMEDQPDTFKNDPAPMVTVHKMALTNIGRRMLEGSIVPQDSPELNGKGPINRPPKTATGKPSVKTGSPLKSTSAKMSTEMFNRLPLAEKEKILIAQGQKLVED